jgi:hypothetical protein
MNGDVGCRLLAGSLKRDSATLSGNGKRTKAARKSFARNFVEIGL